MENCKDYKIYKFDYSFHKSKKKEEIRNKLRWDRCLEMSQFKVKLIDTYSPENFLDLHRYTSLATLLKLEQAEYISPNNKPMLFDSYEIGLDMIQTLYGVRLESHWMNQYYIVPIKHTDVIEWFDTNVPEWVTTVNRL